MGEKQRYDYLDLLKVMAMLCVCLYHFPMIRHTAYVRPFPAYVLALRYLRALNVICVPLFMMVNGALVLNRPFRISKHVRRCAALFVGVYLWYIVTMVLGHLFANGGAYVLQNWQGILMSAQYLAGYGELGTSHLWFVHMLLAVYLITPMLRSALDSGDEQTKKGLLFFLTAMGVFAFLLKDISHVRAAVPVLRNLDLSALESVNPYRGMYGAMITYFVLGGMMHRNYARMLKTPAWLCAAMVLGGSAVLFAEWYLVTIRTEAMYDIVFGGYNCLPALVMTVGLFVAAAKLEDELKSKGIRLSRVITMIGRNTLAVYYLHWIMGLTVLNWVQIPGCMAVNLIKAAMMVLVGTLMGEGLRHIPGLRWFV